MLTATAFPNPAALPRPTRSSTETAVCNALGQRIQISGGAAGTVLYTYDEAGHLLGEYDGAGALTEETVWLGDIPPRDPATERCHRDRLLPPQQSVKYPAPSHPPRKIWFQVRNERMHSDHRCGNRTDQSVDRSG